MLHRSSIGCIALAVLGMASAHAQDGTKFPDWKGMWVRIGAGGQYDPTKPPVRGQQPPLKPEYQAIWEKNIAEGRAGGQYYNTQVRCLPGGMPRMMMAYEPMEVIILPEITYIHITFNNEFRRIYTDGRKWPDFVETSFSGYSIGRWTDADADGRFQTLEVETRHLKGPRIFDPSGIPLHEDNKSIVKERIYLDKENPEPAAQRTDHDRQCPDAALDRHQALSPRAQPDLDRAHLRREQRLSLHREGYLSHRPGRQARAVAQGPGAAGSAAFRSIAQVTAFNPYETPSASAAVPRIPIPPSARRRARRPRAATASPAETA